MLNCSIRAQKQATRLLSYSSQGKTYNFVFSQRIKVTLNALSTTCSLQFCYSRSLAIVPLALATSLCYIAAPYESAKHTIAQQICQDLSIKASQVKAMVRCKANIYISIFVYVAFSQALHCSLVLSYSLRIRIIGFGLIVVP